MVKFTKEQTMATLVAWFYLQLSLCRGDPEDTAFLKFARSARREYGTECVLKALMLLNEISELRLEDHLSLAAGMALLSGGTDKEIEAAIVVAVDKILPKLEERLETRLQGLGVIPKSDPSLN